MRIQVPAILFCVFLVGCVNISAKRFPELPELLSEIDSESIDVLVDVTILADIRGDEPGLDVDTNKHVQGLVAGALVDSLSRRGYRPNVVHLGSALTYKKVADDDVKVLRSEDWKSTGEYFVGPYEVVDGDPTQSDGLLNYLDELVTKARSAVEGDTEASAGTSATVSHSLSSEVSSANDDDRMLTILAMKPELITELQSDLLLYVSLTGYEVSAGKMLGLALLSSAVGVGTGGQATFTANFPPSSTVLEYALIHQPTSQIMWHYKPYQSPAYEFMDEIVEGHIKHLPGASGEFVSAKNFHIR